MSLSEDIEVVNSFITSVVCNDEKSIIDSWERVKQALKEKATNDTTKPVLIDSRVLYRCKCGFEIKTDSKHEQYCPCGEKMEEVK